MLGNKVEDKYAQVSVTGVASSRHGSFLDLRGARQVSTVFLLYSCSWFHRAGVFPDLSKVGLRPSTPYTAFCSPYSYVEFKFYFLGATCERGTCLRRSFVESSNEDKVDRAYTTVLSLVGEFQPGLVIVPYVSDKF